MMTDQNSKPSVQHPFQAGHDTGYEMGQWAVLNRLLNYLNTLEDRNVDKVRLYHEIFEWRPQPKSEERPHV